MARVAWLFYLIHTIGRSNSLQTLDEFLKPHLGYAVPLKTLESSIKLVKYLDDWTLISEEVIIKDPREIIRKRFLAIASKQKHQWERVVSIKSYLTNIE